MDVDGFARTDIVLNRLKNVLKCQLCSELRDESLIIFYRSCDHFFCLPCLSETVCPICDANLEGPVKLKDDKNMLSLYRCALNLKLPSREEITSILSKKKIGDKSEIIKEMEPSLGKTNIQETPKLASGEKTTRIRKSNDPNDASKKQKTIPSCNDSEPVKRSSKAASANVMLKKITIGAGDASAKMSPSAVKPLNNETPTTAKVTPASKVTPVTSTTKKKLNTGKRNPKGETPLHLACKKENITLMKDLIEAGASPNAQDNAGWTPLHDSVDKGSLKVIKFLLENGAKVNTPGLENNTPLHQAVAAGNLGVTKVLMSYGADVKSRNIFGDTPLELAQKFQNKELEEILLHTDQQNLLPLKKNPSGSNSEENIVVYGCSLNADEKMKLIEFAEAFSVKLINTVTPKSNVTHIVVTSQNKITIDWTIVSCVCFGCWPVSSQWVLDSLENASIKAAEKYEVEKGLLPGFVRSRLNKLNQQPGLFSGCHFFFGGVFNSYRVGSMDIPKEELKYLVESNGGVILKRSPDPESLALELTIPYHASAKSSVAHTSYYIIYQTEKWDPKPKYNMKHMKALPVDWLIGCIVQFKILDPIDSDYLFSHDLENCF